MLSNLSVTPFRVITFPSVISVFAVEYSTVPLAKYLLAGSVGVSGSVGVVVVPSPSEAQLDVLPPLLEFNTDKSIAPSDSTDLSSVVPSELDILIDLIAFVKTSETFVKSFIQVPPLIRHDFINRKIN